MNRDRTEPADGTAPSAPARCPDCGSKNLTTTSKVISADSYWRCSDCGVVWNAGRLHAASQNSRRWPYRR